MNEAPLPPIPRRPGSTVKSSLVFAFTSLLLYCTLLSDHGLLVLFCEPYRHLAPTDVVNIKLDLLMAVYGLKLLRDACLLLRGRIALWEWPLSLLIFACFWFEFLLVNVPFLN